MSDAYRDLRKHNADRVLRMFGQARPTKGEVESDMTFGHARRELKFSEWLGRNNFTVRDINEAVFMIGMRKEWR